MQQVCGIVFLDKPKGWTSRRAVNEVSRCFSIPGARRIKAGHAGTLDPLASGMLPILLGDATRFAEMGLNAEKQYRFTFDLSFQTDTLDCEGEVAARFEHPIPQAELEAVLPYFRGEIMQVPPVYSAIRIGGKRAHELARKGEDVVMQERSVTVFALDLITFDYPHCTLQVRCSKGTYVRSLARDIGAALGQGGCVTELRRLSTGGWPEAMMVTPEQLQQEPVQSLLPLAQWLRDLHPISLDHDSTRRFLQGQRIQLRETGNEEICENVVVLNDNSETVLGTGSLQPGLRHMVLHPARILPSAQRLYL